MEALGPCARCFLFLAHARLWLGHTQASYLGFSWLRPAPHVLRPKFDPFWENFVMLNPSALKDFFPVVMTPSHDGKYFHNYVLSLLNSVSESGRHNMPLQVFLSQGESLVTRARNNSTAAFFMFSFLFQRGLRRTNKPAASPRIRLGQAWLRSRRGEPLVIDVPIPYFSCNALENLSIAVRCFKRDAVDHFSDNSGEEAKLTALIRETENGRFYLRLSSHGTVDCPGVDLSVLMEGVFGHVHRDYRLMLRAT